MWVDGYGKAGSAFHWDAFQAQYGEEAGYFVFLTADKSMDDLDAETADGDFAFGHAVAHQFGFHALSAAHGECLVVRRGA